jgi:hypothetical protein
MGMKIVDLKRVQWDFGPLEPLMEPGLPPVRESFETISYVERVARLAYEVLSPSFPPELMDALAMLEEGRTYGLCLENVPYSEVPKNWTAETLCFSKSQLFELALNDVFLQKFSGNVELNASFPMGSDRNSSEFLRYWVQPNKKSLGPHWDRVPLLTFAGVCSEKKSVETRFYSWNNIADKNHEILDKMHEINGKKYPVFHSYHSSHLWGEGIELNSVVYNNKAIRDVFSLEEIQLMTADVPYESLFIEPGRMAFVRDQGGLHQTVHHKADPARLLAIAMLLPKDQHCTSYKFDCSPTELAAYITEQRLKVGLPNLLELAR